jgi:hypothetical protein
MTKVICNSFDKHDGLMNTWDNVPKEQCDFDNLRLHFERKKQRLKGNKKQRSNHVKAFVVKEVV